jgi:N,N'-diacetyllegionaminate synthase
MNSRILIIAEAGVNHNGDLFLAKKLVDIAADAGADLVKFQTFSADRIATRLAQKANYQQVTTGVAESQLQMLQKLELTEDMHFELLDHCKKMNIGFFSTAFDIESLRFLDGLGMERIKVPSGEITNLPFLRFIAGLSKPVILSTGMSTMDEIGSALGVLEERGLSRDLITVLHCTSEYPAPFEEVNLRAMQSIKNEFGVAVGYSDHSSGIEVAIAAAALGASVIEKHFTLSKGLSGPDHKASLEPAELKTMISAVRNLEMALGDGIKLPTVSENENKKVARKSLVASKSIKAGDTFTADNLTVKRPGTGISPMLWDDVIGTKAIRNFTQNELIEI